MILAEFPFITGSQNLPPIIIPPGNNNSMCFPIPMANCSDASLYFVLSDNCMCIFKAKRSCGTDCDVMRKSVNDTHACFSNLNLTNEFLYHFVCARDRCAASCFGWEVIASGMAGRMCVHACVA